MKTKKLLLVICAILSLFSLTACSLHIDSSKEDFEKKIEDLVEEKVGEFENKFIYTEDDSVEINEREIENIYILDKDGKEIAKVSDEKIIQKISNLIGDSYENSNLVLKLPKDAEGSYTYVFRPYVKDVKDVYVSFKVYSNYNYITMESNVIPINITFERNKKNTEKLNDISNFVEIKK